MNRFWGYNLSTYIFKSYRIASAKSCALLLYVKSNSDLLLLLFSAEILDTIIIAGARSMMRRTLKYLNVVRLFSERFCYSH